MRPVVAVLSVCVLLLPITQALGDAVLTAKVMETTSGAIPLFQGSESPKSVDEGMPIRLEATVSAPNDSTLSRYVVQVDGAAWQGPTPVRGIALPSTQQEVPVAEGGKRDLKQYILTWPLGRFAADQLVTVTLKRKSADDPATFDFEQVLSPVWVEDLYRFTTQIGILGTDLGSDKLTRRPSGENSVLAMYDGGTEVALSFAVAMYMEERPASRKGAGWKQQTCLMVGTDLSDPFNTVFAGVGWEFTPGANLMLGYGLGKIADLAPGYKLGDVVDATGSLPTVEKWDGALIFGVTYNVDIFTKIFGQRW